MPGPWTNNQICPNQPYGQHIVVRCSGCNSIHSTKNIGWLDPKTKKASLARSLFDTLGTYCLCEDSGEYPLVHDCEIDDNLEYNFVGPEDVPLGEKENPFGKNHKHIAKTQKARGILQSWWKRFCQSKELGEPTQEDLDELVLLREV